jgi:hypothetical protein
LTFSDQSNPIISVSHPPLLPLHQPYLLYINDDLKIIGMGHGQGNIFVIKYIQVHHLDTDHIITIININSDIIMNIDLLSPLLLCIILDFPQARILPHLD